MPQSMPIRSETRLGKGFKPGKKVNTKKSTKKVAKKK
jgi:hypothetical protein